MGGTHDGGMHWSSLGDAQLRVPKHPVAVTVWLEGGYSLKGDLHVSSEADLHSGRERVIDLLLGEESFLPLTGAGISCLVQKSRIVRVDISGTLDAGLDDIEEATGLVALVEINLVGLPGDPGRVRGEVRIEMPPGRQRLLDYLNEAGDFFPVLTEQGPVLVSRQHVLSASQV